MRGTCRWILRRRGFAPVGAGVTSRCASMAAGMVRGWARLYTWRMAPEQRESRRAEIESDLWEFQHDADSPSRVSPSVHLLARLLRGIPDDLTWRAEHVTVGRLSSGASITVTTMAVAFVVAAFWLYDVMSPQQLPAPPPIMAFVAAPPPPPLPSPPPPPPASIGPVASESVTTFSRHTAAAPQSAAQPPGCHPRATAGCRP